MAGARVIDFMGTFPMDGPRVGKDNAAVFAKNCELNPGSLNGINGNVAAQAVASGTRCVYRIPTTPDTSDWANSFWMEFTDPDVNVIHTPIVNDQFDRFYWAGPATPPRYGSKAQILAGGAGVTYELGVDPPVTGLFSGTTGGGISTSLETRAYLVTFVTTYGEESAPCSPISVTGKSDAVFLLSNIPQPTGVTSAPISLIRIYRTVTSTNTSNYYKVVDLGVGQTSYGDTLANTQILQNTTLGTTNWAPPPSNLEGLVLMPSGILAGWFGNTVCFSEPFYPHSWPPSYRQAVEHDIVGMGVFGSSLVVATTGKPAMITGTKSSTMSMSTNSTPLTCLSRRSIVSTPDGVYYASDSGLVRIGPQGVANLTETFVTRTDWNNLFLPKLQQAVYFGSIYYVVRPDGTGFCVRPNGLDLGTINLDMGLTTYQVAVDLWSGRPFILNPSQISELMAPAAPRKSYVWRSKEFVTPFPINMSVIQTFYDDMGTYSSSPPMHAKVWAYQRPQDGEPVKTLVYDHDIAGSEQAIRLPGDLRSDVWQFEITANADTHEVMIASSVTELKNA